MTSFTTSEVICNKLNDKSSNNIEPSKRSLYILIQGSKKAALFERLLRLLRPDERILDLHKLLMAHRIQHDFYALINSNYEKLNQEAKMKEFNENFFKEGKWERVGDLFKGSEKTLEGDADKRQPFSKKTFYLGKDILYYISKDRIFSGYSYKL